MRPSGSSNANHNGQHNPCASKAGSAGAFQLRWVSLTAGTTGNSQLKDEDYMPPECQSVALVTRRLLHGHTFQAGTNNFLCKIKHFKSATKKTIMEAVAPRLQPPSRTTSFLSEHSENMMLEQLILDCHYSAHASRHQLAI